VELTADRSARTPYDPAQNVGARVAREMRRRGVITRIKGDSILLAPPLVTTPDQMGRIVEATEGAIQAVVGV